MFFIFFADDVERSTLRSDAHYFVDHAQDQALASDSDIRDPEVLQRAYLEYLDDDGSRFTLADGTPVLGSDLDGLGTQPLARRAQRRTSMPTSA